MAFLTYRGNNLANSGPVVEVVFTVPQSIADQLKLRGEPQPAIKVLALIDTGASNTCICEHIVHALALLPFDVQNIFTAGGPTNQLLYDIGVALPISQNNIISVQAPCADLNGQPFQALLGRDVLSLCSLFYNGPDNSFSLHF